jgi:hypothetical protein
MKPAFAVLVIVALAGCGGSPSTPSAPSAPVAPTTPGGTLVLSGIVFEITATARRPLVGATVEITESSWGDYPIRPTTDQNGRYAFGSLMPRHYLVRASKAGYDEASVVNLGFMETSRTQNFDLTLTGSSAALTITSIEPASGSTGGGASMKIIGSGFKTGTTVSLGTDAVTAYAANTTTLYFTAAARAAGIVDVVVSTGDGRSTTLARGFTYAAPQSFDFNGTWIGYALAHPPLAALIRPMHSDMDMQLTVENNMLTSFTCGGADIAFSALAISNGEFSLAPEFIPITGRIVSGNEVTGTIDTPTCPKTLWYATKQ